MLQRDYINEIIRQFCDVLARWLRPAVLEANGEAIEEVEAAIGKLMDLDGATALSLAPESLVTMMELMGIADSVAGYVSYTLLRLGDAYDAAGSPSLANLRREQAQAVSVAFQSEFGKVPEEYEELERTLAAERGEE